MRPFITILSLMITLVGCQNSKDIKQIRTSASLNQATEQDTDSSALPKNTIKYSIKNQILIKEIKEGLFIKANYPEVQAMPASQTIVNINNKIKQERNEILERYISFIDNETEAFGDTLIHVDIEASIWANELLSLRYSYFEMVTSFEQRGNSNLSYAHYSLTKGTELSTTDIFNSSVAERWREWLKINVSSELYQMDASWEDHGFFDMSFDEDNQFIGTWQEFYDQILKHGYYLIKENGDLDYSIYFQRNISTEETMPYQEIRDYFKIRPAL